MQHDTLSPQRWAAFSRAAQILMIANEMHRLQRLCRAEDRERRRNAYERVLNLCDLTVLVNRGHAFRRELLRWREVVAERYLAEEHDPEAHRVALRALLLLTPESAKQIRYVCGGRGDGSASTGGP